MVRRIAMVVTGLVLTLGGTACARRPWQKSAWKVPLWWMVGLVLMGLLGRALA